MVAVLLLVSALLFAGVVGVQAETTPTVTVQSKTIHRGQRFEVDVTLTGNSGLVSLRMALGYDLDAAKLVEVRRGTALKSHTLDYNIDRNQPLFNWVGMVPDKSEGVLVTLVFEGLTESAADNFTVAVRVDPDNTLADIGKKQPVATVDGTVTVTKDDFYYVFVNYDGTELWRSVRVAYGTPAPAYAGKEPTRPEDSKYTYIFGGKWQQVASDKADEVVFEPVFDTIAKSYIVDFYVADNISDVAQKTYTYTKNYNQTLTFPQMSREGYAFVGWYTDKYYTQKFAGDVMPEYNLTLYGYWRVALREQGPVIALSYADKDESGNLLVDVNMTANNGVAVMKLNLEYDKTALTYVGYTAGDALQGMNLFTSGAETDKTVFQWMSDNNCYGTGKVMTLRFAVKDGAKNGGYRVAFTYDRNSDVIYLGGNGKMWFSLLSIDDFVLPVGTVNRWNAVPSGGERDVDVTSETDMPGNVTLDVKLVTSQIPLTDKLANAVGKGEIKDAYEIRLVSNGVEVSPTGKLTVRLRLSLRQQLSGNVRLLHYAEDGTVEVVPSRIEGGCLVFETDHLSTWIVVGNPVDVHNNDCLSWAIVALCAVSVLMITVVVCFGGHIGINIVAGLWAFVSAGETAYVLYLHTCTYTIVTAILAGMLFMLIFVAMFYAAAHKKPKGVVSKIRVKERGKGCYMIREANGGYTFDVCDGSGNVIASAVDNFDSAATAKQYVNIVKTACANAVDDLYEKDEYPRFAVYYDGARYRFTLATEANKVLVRSERFETKRRAHKAAEHMRKHMS